MNNAFFPLAMVSIGEHVRLESIHGGDKLVQRLTALGLTPGAEISIVQDNGGALLVSVRDSRIALGRGMASKVMVKLLDKNEVSNTVEGVQDVRTTGCACGKSERRQKHHLQRANWFAPARR